MSGTALPPAALRRLEEQFLRSCGWSRSVLEQAAVGQEGPMPWFTYPSVRFLERIIRPQWRVLEYGGGNSTRWWAARVAEVFTVEHDPAWAASLRAALPPNVRLAEHAMDDCPDPEAERLLREEFFPLGCLSSETADPTRNYRAGLLDGAYRAYAAAGLAFPAGYFDVIVVDGMARTLCAWVAARQLGPEGIVVFDNADRNEYAPAYRLLAARGFTRIDFWGLGPINPYEWCTALFVRSLRSLSGAAP